jgi:hypothetical protein
MLHTVLLAMVLVLQQQHAATVHADSGTVEITLSNDSASVRLSTPGRAFQLDLDSLTLAMWADTAAALRGPRKGAKETEYPAARLATNIIAMAIIRLSTDSASSYVFAATGYAGLNGRLTLPYDSAQRLFAVMRAPPLDVPKGASASRVNPIVFEFVVDTTGHVESQTFHIVSTPDPAEAEAIAQSLRESPYRPAEKDGHKVRELVHLTYYFVRH